MATRILKRVIPSPISKRFLSQSTRISSNFSTNTKPIQITLFPGHGVGPEISQSVKQVFNTAEVPIEWEEHLVGDAVDPRTKSLLTRENLESLRRNGVGLKGPMDTPLGKAGGRSIDFTFKNELGIHSYVRPFNSVYGYEASRKDMNLVLIRETPKCVIPAAIVEESESDSDETSESNKDEDVDEDEDEDVVKKPEDNRKNHIFEPDFIRERSMQVVEYAFNYAKAHEREKIHAIHHPTIIKNVDDIFLECCRDVAKNFPEIGYEEIDTEKSCMRIVRDPAEFDVLVMPNYHGFVMTDFIERSFGDIGLLPSCFIGEDGITLAEPVHGTSLDIAGKGQANPTAMLLSAVMTLRHLKLDNKADQIHNAVMRTILEGKYRTIDLGGTSTTEEFTKAICDNL